MSGALRSAWLVALGLAALMAASALLRIGGMDTGFWIDEALSVGIADRPLTEIPATLRQDGSPPLYYLILHAWLALFGSGEVATHALSLVIALLCVPAAWWALRDCFGARAAWIAAALAATNPFITQYAQETRMYSLVVLLGLLTCGAFLRAFVYERAGWRLPFGALLAAMLYTHNWALFFAAACGLTWLGLVAGADGRRRRWLLRAGVVSFGTTALLYLPWVPSMLFQAAHTGAPWALAPPVSALPSTFGRLLGPVAVFVLLVTAGAGLALIVRARRGGGLRREAVAIQRRSVLALVSLALLTLVIAWLSSQVAPAWALRYLAVAVPPLLVLAAIGLSRAGGVGLAGLAVVAVLWATDEPPAEKSNVREVTELLEPKVRPGDLVVSTQPEQIPALSYYLPDGLDYATLWGPVDDVGVTDWRDGVQRLRRTSADRDLDPLIERLEPGRRLVLVEPIAYDRRRWSAPWTELVRVRSVEWRHRADADPRLAITATYPPTSYPPRPNPVRATVWIRLPVD